MKEFLAWWLTMIVIGGIAFPITFTVLRFLPDRGYTMTKVLGILLPSYLLWMGATVGLFPNSRGSILLILLALAVVSLLVAGRSKYEMAAFIRERWRYILLVEGLFLVALAVAAFLRSYVPEIEHTEKPMDIAFLNGIVRARHFPPEDPWLAGYALSYYYFGHVMVGLLTVLTGIPTYITFNLGIALVGALAAVAVFGLVFNLVSMLGASLERAVAFGMAGIVALLILGNLEGIFELLAVHGIGSASFYRFLDIEGLDGPRPSNAWYPTEFWWWWRATRVASQWDWREPPIFSFALGDLHAHVMSIPFVLLAMAIAVNFLRWRGPLGWRFWADNPAWLPIMAVTLGGLAFLNAWDFPTFLLLLALMVLVKEFLDRKRLDLRAVTETLGFMAPLAVVSVLLYVPFYADFHPVGEGVHPLEAATRGWAPLESTVTSPHHFFYIWGALFWLVVVLTAATWRRPARSSLLLPATAPALVPIGLWALMILYRRGISGFVDELSVRGASLITAAVLVVFLTLAAFVLLQNLLAALREDGPAMRAVVFTLTAAVIGFLLLLGQEFYWVDDPVDVRSNTVFRLSYQVSILFAVCGVIGLYYATRGWDLAGLVSPQRLAWGALTVIVIGAAMVYPVTLVFARTDGFTGTRTLNGLYHLAYWNQPVYESMLWLSTSVEGTPRILEAIGGDYSAYGRVAAYTGLPTVLGWPDHEYRWRGSWHYQEGRQTDVEVIYKTPDLSQALELLAKYDIRYVYVGPLEIERYGTEGLAKFAVLEPAFQNQAVTVYHVPQTEKVTPLVERAGR